MASSFNFRDWETRIRLYTAIALGVYELLAQLYYASGLISPSFMTAVRLAEAPVSNLLFPVFSAALYIHMALGLWKLFRRNTLAMPAWEVSQIALGLSIPLLMLTPTVAFLLMDARFGLGLSTTDALLVTHPETAWRSIAMTLVIGLHAAIGTHAMLRMRPWYPQARAWITLGFIAIPLAAAAGYFQSGALAAQVTPVTLTPEQLAFYRETDAVGIAAVLGGYAVILLLREWRLTLRRAKLTATVHYAGGQSVAVAPGTTVLETSRIGGVAHPSICGGRARCTTCRIRVDDGMDRLSDVGDRERKALTRIGAGPNLRLACQAECRGGDVSVTILFPQHHQAQQARQENRNSVGRDVELTVMFVDLRGFTGMADKKFPYDVVYILNSYFQAMGDAILEHGGTVDKFLGDGILAYFGLDLKPEAGARAALACCRAMADSLIRLNERLAHIWPAGLNIGVGIHFGDVVLGEIGSNEMRQLTIVGDTVNTTSRLEALNKQAESQLIVSTNVTSLAGVKLEAPTATVTPRGKSDPLKVYVVKKILHELILP